ncbi:DUF3253 domain-containing protein [soil metagenome]
MESAAPTAPSPIEETTYALLAERDPGKSICPSEVARALDPVGWRRMMGQVRGTAVGLARAGRLVITRHGKPVDPNAFKGVYRLRLPDDPASTPPEEPA